MRGGAALHGRKGGGAMPRGKRAYRVLLWAVLAALLALAAFAGWRLWRVYGDAARAAQLARKCSRRPCLLPVRAWGHRRGGNARPCLPCGL